MTIAVTTTNIIIGACTSFKVDGTVLGGTSGGVSVEKKRTYVDLQIDQVPGIVKKGIKEETYTVKTSLAEATLAHLQVAWGLSTAPVVATTPASTTLSLGVETTPVEHTLVFVGPAPTTAGYTTRTFTLNRAIAMVTGAMEISKDKETLFPVEFECLPNLADAGAEYGTVVDQ